MTCAESDQYWVLADCLKEYGYENLVFPLLTSTKSGFFEHCLSIIKKEAIKRFDSNVLERLYFSGLIYSTEVSK